MSRGWEFCASRVQVPPSAPSIIKGFGIWRFRSPFLWAFSMGADLKAVMGRIILACQVAIPFSFRTVSSHFSHAFWDGCGTIPPAMRGKGRGYPVMLPAPPSGSRTLGPGSPAWDALYRVWKRTDYFQETNVHDSPFSRNLLPRPVSDEVRPYHEDDQQILTVSQKLLDRLLATLKSLESLEANL
jgi:hypothetical protein